MPTKKTTRKRLPKRRLSATNTASARDIKREITAVLEATLKNLKSYKALLHRAHMSDCPSMYLIEAVREAMITDCIWVEAAFEPSDTDKPGGAYGRFIRRVTGVDNGARRSTVGINPRSGRLKVVHPKQNK